MRGGSRAGPETTASRLPGRRSTVPGPPRATHGLPPVLRELSRTAAAISLRSSSTTAGNVAADEEPAMALPDVDASVSAAQAALGQLREGLPPQTRAARRGRRASPRTRGRGCRGLYVAAGPIGGVRRGARSVRRRGRSVRRRGRGVRGLCRACRGRRTRRGHVPAPGSSPGPRPSAGRGAAVRDLLGAPASGAGRRSGARSRGAAVPSRAARRGLRPSAAAGR